MNKLEDYAIIVNYEVSDSETDHGDPSNENYTITEDEAELKIDRHIEMEEEFNHNTFVKKDIKSDQETCVMIAELESDSGEKITINMIKTENETEHVTDQTSVNQDDNSNKLCLKSENIVYNCPKIENCNAASELFVQCKRCEHCFTDNLQYLDHKLLCVAEKDSDKMLAVKIETDEITKPYSDKTFQSGKDLQETETLPLIKQQFPFTTMASGEDEIINPCEESFLSIPYENLLCATCGKSFKRKFALQRHMKIHDGTRRFKCTDCDKSYNSRYDLDNHKRSKHEGEKITCDTCGKTFSYKQSLLQHANKCNRTANRTDDQDIKCTRCDYKGKKNDVQTHVAAKHMEQYLYVCKLCGQKFKWRSSLAYHSKRHEK